MRILSWRLIVALVIGVTLVSVASSWYEVKSQKDALRSDLERKAATLEESLAATAQLYLQADDRDGLEDMVERFGNREHLVGIGVYGPDDAALAITPALNSLMPGSPRILTDALHANRPENNYMRLHFKRVYVLAIPLHGAKGAVIGGILMAHDTGYIRNEIFLVWGRVFVRIALQVLVIVAITILIVRWSLTKPIARVADWIKALRTGQHAPPPTPSDMDFLLPLTREVAPLAKSIQTARGAAATEARLRNANESEWTAQRLAAHVRSRLQGSSLFVVANREPYIHNWRDGAIQVSVPASGLVAAIEPILCACNGTWVAHGSGNADMEVTDEHDRLQVPPDEPLYTLRRIWLSAEEEDGYYYGFANEGLWPLCHNAHTRPIFRASDWEHYYNVNQKFADVLVEEIGNEEHPVVLIQDYHFALLPRMVKNRLPHARIAIFWHIPWPNPENFEICPWQRELLDGLLGADLIGFHVRAHCNNFLNTVDHVLEARIDWEHFSVKRNDHTSLVLPFPISVECCNDTSPTHDGADDRRAVLKEAGVEATYVGVGVDRIDYTKGIVERFQAVESFLERYPSYQGKFTFFQLGAPTRTHIKRYADFQAEVEAEASRINARFKRGRWSPIVLQVRQHSKQEVQRYYRIAHLCMVTSLHDGMNLVAKEFVAAKQDESGVLILSQFTGAARELRDAIIVNPYDIEATGEAIAQALRMDVTEMTERMRRMRNTIREHNIYWWASSLIGTLCEVRLDQIEPVSISANDRVTVET
jgi:trehalose-6-phosphate synthase